MEALKVESDLNYNYPEQRMLVIKIVHSNTLITNIEKLELSNQARYKLNAAQYDWAMARCNR